MSYDPTFVFLQFLNGLTNAMLIFLIASGLSIIFGVLRILNFAHGSLYMLGAYATYQCVSLFTDSPGRFWFALAIAPVAVALFGGILERLLLRRLYRREELSQLLFTYAMVLILGDFARFLWGVDQLSVSRPPILGGAVELLGQYFPKYNIFIIVLGPCIALLFWLLLLRTRRGRMIRAAALDRETLGTLGINVDRLFTVVFMIGAWLAALGGALVAPMTTIQPGMDVDVIIDAFIVVVIGGMGSFWGTFLGCLIVGPVYALGILVFPRLSIVFIYVIMILVLIMRPWGLLGRPLER